MTILKEMQDDEVKKQSNHGLNGLVLIPLAFSQDVGGDVGHAPILKASCDVL